MKKIYIFIAIALFLCSCSSSNDNGNGNGTGTIYGEVTDKVTGVRLSDANVILRPLGTATLTGSQGRYEFTNVEAGTYFLTVTKAGYSDLIDDFEINIKANSSIPRDVQIEKLPESLRLVNADGKDIDGLYFGNTYTSRSFIIFNASTSTLNWEIINDKEWITIDKLTGTLTPGGQESILVTIDPSQLGDGTSITVKSNLVSRDLDIAVFQPSSSSSQIQSSSSGVNATPSSSSGGEISSIDIITTPEGTILRGANLSTKLSWLNRNVESHNTYIVEVEANDNISLYTFNYSGAINVTVILRGDDANRAIRLSSNGTMFEVRTNVTLVLDNNITLQGHSQNTACMVYVNGGILKMNAGAAITGNSYCGVNVYSGTFEMNAGTISSNASGVYMSNSNVSFIMSGGTIFGNTARGVNMSYGTFTMNGGTVSGNAGGVYVDNGTFTMNDGTISGNAASSGGGVYMNGGTLNMRGGIITGNTASEYGGGVYKSSGTFTKTGGIITGYNSDQSEGNKVSDNFGIMPRRGHAVYVSANIRKETTAGPEMNLSAPSYGTVTGTWDE
jgi:hypothetical protein